MENCEKELKRVTELSMLEWINYIQLENLPAAHFPSDGLENTPFIKVIRNELGRNTPTSLQCRVIPVFCGMN